ncbi:PerC family transcriptional regulator [Rahnella ecdela]|uniref:PerC family transcriptional regulator n=1 Tax=Rahnella ecdela TaxID=2816250 RepID=A0ABS6LAK6_9GAMM|nr:PerC family transcriptional regulator [Rahnella ecdela]
MNSFLTHRKADSASVFLYPKFPNLHFPWSELAVIIDEMAESLERAGMYRRAAARWLKVFNSRLSAKEGEWVRKRRNTCLKKAMKPRPSIMEL